jgi:hypothetical protein
VGRNVKFTFHCDGIEFIIKKLNPKKCHIVAANRLPEAQDPAAMHGILHIVLPEWH